VALGYVEPGLVEPGTAVELVVRGRAVPAAIASLPFVPHRYHR
jgi:aminomethyltransferase